MAINILLKFKLYLYIVQMSLTNPNVNPNAIPLNTLNPDTLGEVFKKLTLNEGVHLLIALNKDPVESVDMLRKTTNKEDIDAEIAYTFFNLILLRLAKLYESLTGQLKKKILYIGLQYYDKDPHPDKKQNPDYGFTFIFREESPKVFSITNCTFKDNNVVAQLFIYRYVIGSGTEHFNNLNLNLKQDIQIKEKIMAEKGEKIIDLQTFISVMNKTLTNLDNQISINIQITQIDGNNICDQTLKLIGDDFLFELQDDLATNGQMKILKEIKNSQSGGKLKSNIKELKSMKKTDLMNMARRQNIKGRSTMKRDDLITTLNKKKR